MFSKITICVLAAVVCLSTVTPGQAQTCGHSPIITPRHFLNIPQYLGTWYVQKFAFARSEDAVTPSYKCLSVDYSVKQGNVLLAVENYVWTADGTAQRDTDDVVVENVGAPAYLTVYGNRTNGELMVTDTVVFASDHISYSVSYGCAMLNGSRYETATAWTRARNIDNILDSFLDSLIEGLGFSLVNVTPVDQTGCDL